MLCLFNMQLSCLMCCALSLRLSCTLLLTKITVVCSANNCNYYTSAWRRCWRWRWWRERQQLPVPLPTWTTSWSFPTVTGHAGAACSGYNPSKHATDDVLVSRGLSLWNLPRFSHSRFFHCLDFVINAPFWDYTGLCIGVGLYRCVCLDVSVCV